MCSSQRHFTLSPGAVAGAPLLSLLLFSAQNCTILQCTPAIIFIGGRALFLFLPSQSCFVSGQKLRCNVTMHCARGVLWQDFATRRRSSPSQVGLSSPRWARPCRGSQPQITALRSTSTSKTPFIAIHFEAFSSIFVSCNSLKRNEFNLLLRCTLSTSKQASEENILNHTCVACNDRKL